MLIKKSGLIKTLEGTKRKTYEQDYDSDIEIVKKAKIKLKKEFKNAVLGL